MRTRTVLSKWRGKRWPQKWFTIHRSRNGIFLESSFDTTSPSRSLLRYDCFTGLKLRLSILFSDRSGRRNCYATHFLDVRLLSVQPITIQLAWNVRWWERGAIRTINTPGCYTFKWLHMTIWVLCNSYQWNSALFGHSQMLQKVHKKSEKNTNFYCRRNFEHEQREWLYVPQKWKSERNFHNNVTCGSFSTQ